MPNTPKTTMRPASQSSAATATAIVQRQSFATYGALRGKTEPYDTGLMRPDTRETFRADKPTYAVYSYGTPIAWYGERGWVIPTDKFSVTTSKHQGIVRRAVGTYQEGDE